jgi:hypothetical protein
MLRSRRRVTVCALVAGVVALVPASMSSACIFLASFSISPASVQPGGSLTVDGIRFGINPVDIRLDSPTGRLLSTVVPDGRNFHAQVTIPPDVGAGRHVLVASQAPETADGRNNGSAQGVPAQAVFQVGTPAPPAAATRGRPVQVANRVSIGVLLLVGAAVAGVGLIVGALTSRAVSHGRRPAAPALTQEK